MSIFREEVEGAVGGGVAGAAMTGLIELGHTGDPVHAIKESAKAGGVGALAGAIAGHAQKKWRRYKRRKRRQQ